MEVLDKAITEERIRDTRIGREETKLSLCKDYVFICFEKQELAVDPIGYLFDNQQIDC